MAENGAGNAIVIDRRFLTTEDRIGEGLAFANGYGRQLDAIGNVSDRVDMLDIRTGKFVDLDLALVAKFNANFLEAEPLRMRNASGGEENAVDFHVVRSVQRHVQCAVFLFDAIDRRVEMELNALGRRNHEQAVAQRLIVTAQQRVGAIDDRYFAAELVEDASELVGDVTAAHDQGALGYFVEMKRVVRRDAKLGTGKVGHVRRRPGRDENGLGRDGLAAFQGDLVRAGQRHAFVEDCDVMAFERFRIQTVQPVDVRENIVAQRDPVELGLADIPAECLRILQIFGELRTIDEHLLRNAAANDASAANAVFLRDGHARSVSGRNAGSANAPRAGADGEKVIIVFVGHQTMLLGLARRYGPAATMPQPARKLIPRLRANFECADQLRPALSRWLR